MLGIQLINCWLLLSLHLTGGKLLLSVQLLNSWLFKLIDSWLTLLLLFIFSVVLLLKEGRLISQWSRRLLLVTLFVCLLSKTLIIMIIVIVEAVSVSKLRLLNQELLCLLNDFAHSVLTVSPHEAVYLLLLLMDRLLILNWSSLTSASSTTIVARLTMVVDVSVVACWVRVVPL